MSQSQGFPALHSPDHPRMSRKMRRRGGEEESEEQMKGPREALRCRTCILGDSGMRNKAIHPHRICQVHAAGMLRIYPNQGRLSIVYHCGPVCSSSERVHLAKEMDNPSTGQADKPNDSIPSFSVPLRKIFAHDEND